MYDVLVIGAGISGASAARELSRYKLKTAVIEKGGDVCAAASRGNSATVHSGHDATFGTLKARYNVLGNAMFDKICSELNVSFNRNGTIIMARSEKDIAELEKLKQNAEKNGVPGVRILSREELIEREGYFGEEIWGGLLAPTGGMVCPYSLVIALCENAALNGADFYLDSEVRNIVKTEDGFTVSVGGRQLRARFILNCAGTHADEINDMVCSHSFSIIPRKGEHIILDKKLAPFVKATLSQPPENLPGGGHTKGMGIMPSVDGTIILGCGAHEVADRDDSSTTRQGLEEICDYFEKVWSCLPISKEYPKFPRGMIIGAFGGLRPHPDTDDFIIGEAKDVPGFFNMAGIESPGLTAAPAIAEELVEMMAHKYGFEKNEDFDPIRPRKKPFREMTALERAAAFAENNEYGHIVCRCEQVTRAEIRDAIRGPVGAKTVNAVKMRTRAGMGRCQGGFCGPEVAKILSEELRIDMLEVTQSGDNSQILVCRTCQETQNEEV